MDKRKEEIVAVALKRFAHYGFNKTTMNEVAEDLSITKANLYYYYPDKVSLIKDVILHVGAEIFAEEEAIVGKYNFNLLEILIEILELKASYMRKYYVLHINENLEWIKGLEINKVFEDFYERDLLNVRKILRAAVDSGEVVLDDVGAAAQSYVDIMKGLAILCNASDILTGIPNAENVDKILITQKKAVDFIFKGKLVNK